MGTRRATKLIAAIGEAGNGADPRRSVIFDGEGYCLRRTGADPRDWHDPVAAHRAEESSHQGL
jgi:hypothetical protein